MREGFLWGVATSAFQLEGSPHADWASWDDILNDQPSLTEHYQRYRDDLRLLRELGVNAYRFSIEWSRIQPRENTWDSQAVAHYQGIIDILHSNGIEPMVTIHHFTHPLWFIQRYPWHTNASIDKFLKFVERLISTIKNVRYWITFNEPYVLLLGGYLEGCMPPGLRDVSLLSLALRNILVCHGRIYDLIHAQTPTAMVSVAHNMAALAPWNRWNPFDRTLALLARRFYNQSLLEAFRTGIVAVQLPLRQPWKFDVPIKGKLDFVGVNYYTRMHLRFNPFRKLGIELRHRDIDGHGLTDLGWEVYPRGLAKVLQLASVFGMPLIVTENGIATRNVQKKIRFMRRHLDIIEQCISNGLDVRGYFYWSLIDNYEWLQGLDARFGLYHVDFKTLERKATSAASYYAYVIKTHSHPPRFISSL